MKMRILLCTHLLIVAASLAAAQGPNAPASELNTIDAPESKIMNIFNGGNGDNGLADGWMAPSIDTAVNTSDTENARPGSDISLSANVEPVSSFLLATMTPFSVSSNEGSSSVLDVWLRGSVLIRGALKIQDLSSGSESSPLVLANLVANDPVTNTSRLLGPASDDYFRLQVNLDSFLLQEKNFSSWDSIVLEDVSGQGFDIFIDQMRLVPSSTTTTTTAALTRNGKTEIDALGLEDRLDRCVGTACNPILTASSAASDLVPLYGGDITALDADSPSPVIARLLPGVSTGQVLALCQELTGPNGRFDGSCTLQPTFDNTQQVQALDLEAPVEWPFLAITAKSESDLKAMRSALQEMVEYFDRDKIASISFNGRKLAGEFTDLVRKRGVRQAKLMLAEKEKKEEKENSQDAEPEAATAAAQITAASVAAAPAPAPAPEEEQRINKPNEILAPQAEMSTSPPPPPSPSSLPPLEPAAELAPAVEVSSNVTTESSCSSTPWNLDRIDQASLPLDNSYTPRNTGAGVHVYVLDTGTRVSHQAFSGRVGTGADCTSSGGCQTGAPTTDGNGHGTHTAGTAVGTCYGVAQGATLHPVKVLGNDGAGSFSGIIDGLRWVTQDVAANGGWPAVASLSLGGDRSKSLDDAVEAVVAAGIPVVVAAGNDFGADACTKSPAGAPSAITVAATDIDDNAAGFSNIGSCVDIWAPGAKITSASNADDSSTRVLSGTSMATPAVAGAIALLLQSNPNASPSELTSRVSASAVNEKTFVSGTTTRFLQVS